MARWRIHQSRYEAYWKKLASFRKTVPFEFAIFSGRNLSKGDLQHLAGEWHCRSLDGLHVAAIQELGQRRLLTNDAKQAAAARALGDEVVSPGMTFPE